jgi:hypothetical protein
MIYIEGFSIGVLVGFTIGFIGALLYKKEVKKKEVKQ